MSRSFKEEYRAAFEGVVADPQHQAAFEKMVAVGEATGMNVGFRFSMPEYALGNDDMVIKLTGDYIADNDEQTIAQAIKADVADGVSEKRFMIDKEAKLLRTVEPS